MRILYVVNSHTWGGGEQVALSSAVGMRRRGHFVAVAVPPTSPLGARCASAHEGLEVIPLHIGPKLGKRTVLEFIRSGPGHRRALLDLVTDPRWARWDVVHLQYKKEQLLATSPLVKRGYRVVWTEHGGLPPAFRRNPLAKAWYLSVARKTSNIAAVSEAVKRGLVRGGVASSRIDVVYNGVDLDAFNPSGGARERWRSEVRGELAWQEDDVVVGTTARLERRKGVDLVIDACADLFGDWGGLRVLIAGVGGAAEALQKAVPPAYRSRVAFVGFQANVARTLAAMDVYASVSSDPGEGFPLRLVEAMCMGLPSTVSAIGGQLEAVREGEEGIVADPPTLVTVRAAILRLIGDPRLREQLGHRARERSRAFAMSRFVEQHERFLLGA